MYHAKELGRNGFRLFSAELASRRTQRLAVETALRRALKNDELALHFQPIVDIGSGEVRRAEALLRWHDPEHGLMLPQGFIPLAEESGLGHAIGHWVMEAACKQARAWRDAGLGDITVCVNLSAGQLRDTSMVADLKRLLHKTGCEPGWLQLEITETSMVRDVEGASVVLAKLRALGVRIAIDDFGTGFSSLSHLRHLPVDVLKIDKAFVADIDSQPAKRKRDNAGGRGDRLRGDRPRARPRPGRRRRGRREALAAELPHARRLPRLPGLPSLPAASPPRNSRPGSPIAGSPSQKKSCQGRPRKPRKTESVPGNYQVIETRAPPRGESEMCASPPCHSATLFTIASPGPRRRCRGRGCPPRA